LVSKDPQTISLLEVGADIGERYKTQAQLCTPEFLFHALKISNDCDIDYRQSKNKRLLVELALIRQCQLADEKKKSILIDDESAPIQKIELSVPTTENKSAVTAEPVKSIATPQPAVAPKAKEPSNDSKPILKRPGSISISTTNTIAEAQPVYNETKVIKHQVIQNKSFTTEELEQTWHQFADTIPEQARMVSFFQTTIPILTSPTAFEITVSNILQEKELKRLHADIQEFIHHKLQNTSIRMTIKVAEETEVQRANTPEDRYKLMADQNPALDILKNGLQLEID